MSVLNHLYLGSPTASTLDASGKASPLTRRNISFVMPLVATQAARNPLESVCLEAYTLVQLASYQISNSGNKVGNGTQH